MRTLHHYDRIGLLRPAARSAGGSRLYGEDDLLRLQQLLTLRYLGFPLKRIGELLDRPDFDLVASLRLQQQALRARIAEMERGSAAVGELVARRLETGDWSWQHVIQASQAVGAGLTRGESDMDALYTPEQMRQFTEARAAATEDEIEAIQQGWSGLLVEARASRGLDPASPQAQALGERWEALTERTMRGFAQFPELQGAIRANYERGAFAGNALAPTAEDFAFIERIKAASAEGAENAV